MSDVTEAVAKEIVKAIKKSVYRNSFSDDALRIISKLSAEAAITAYEAVRQNAAAIKEV